MNVFVPLTERLPWGRIAGPLEAASDALVRLDERLKSSTLREGFAARADFNDACAALWRAGHLVHLEDLVLHDAGMDVRAPTHELVQAHSVLCTRRRLAAADPVPVLTRAGIARLRGVGRPRKAGEPEGQGSVPPIDHDDAGILGSSVAESGETKIYAEVDALLSRTAKVLTLAQEAVQKNRDDLDPHGIVYDPHWHEEALLAEWLSAVTDTESLPPVLAAALALEFWDRLQPLQHQAWLGPLLAAQLLRSRRKTQYHLPALHVGLRFAPALAARKKEFIERLIGSLSAIETAALFGLKELDRLTLARELMQRKCVGRRGNSKLPVLADLFLSLPIVSVPLAAQRLHISQQAATTMIDELKSLTREMTGRGRYRAWAIL